MRIFGRRAAARALALAAIGGAIALLAACQQVFTWSAESGLARPSPSLPAEMTLSQAMNAGEKALEIGDVPLAAAALHDLLGKIDGLSGTQKDEAIVLSVKLGLLASGFPGLLAAAINGSSSSEEESSAATSAAIAALNVKDDILAAFVDLQGLSAPSSIDANTVAYVGMDMILSQTRGQDVSTLTVEEQEALMNNQTYLLGIGYVMAAYQMIEEAGGDPSSLFGPFGMGGS